MIIMVEKCSGCFLTRGFGWRDPSEVPAIFKFPPVPPCFQPLAALFSRPPTKNRGFFHVDNFSIA